VQDPVERQRLGREAVDLLELAAAYKRSEQTRLSLLTTMRILADAYAVVGEHAKAYALMLEFAGLQRVVFNDEGNRRFAEFSQRFELDRQAAQLERAELSARTAQTETQSRNRLLLALTMTCLLALAGLAGMGMLSRARRLALNSSRDLRSAERLLIAAINNAPTGIAVVSCDDQILKINRAALRIFGMEHESPQDWMGRSVETIRSGLAFTELDGRPIENAQLPLALVFRNQRASEQREMVILDGQEGRRVLATAAPVFDATDKLSAAVLALIDITELRMIESQQEQFRIRLNNAERSEAIHLALGGLAHEFANQLGVATGYADLLDATDADTLRELRTALDRSNDLVRQLQLLAGYALPQPSMLRPAELAQQVVDAFAVTNPAATIELHCQPELPSLVGDGKLLRQALSELLSNALESGPLNTTGIRLNVSCISDLAGIAAVAVLRPEWAENYIVYAVHDAGMGMNEHTRKRAFDPYFSGRPNGRGMGLSLVAGILRAHRSGLYLDSCPQTGTRISIVVPAGEKSPTENLSSVRSALQRAADSHH
jgi:PAS domain S-box-containing protein